MTVSEELEGRGNEERSVSRALRWKEKRTYSYNFLRIKGSGKFAQACGSKLRSRRVQEGSNSVG